MAIDRDSPDDLYPFAEVQVRKLVLRYGLDWNRQKKEDAAGELFLAGWQVWRDTGNVGLAKNRIVSRTVNLYRDDHAEKTHEPKAATASLHRPGINEKGELWDDDANREWDVSKDLARMRGEPAEHSQLRELFDNLPEQQRKVALLRAAGYSDQEIADELGISLRTVERELSRFRKENKDDDR